MSEGTVQDRQPHNTGHQGANAATLCSSLAAFTTKLRETEVPKSVRERIALHILDTLGCQIAFATLPWSQNVLRYARAHSAGRSGDATVTYHGDRLPTEIAAFANSAFTHGFEMDDVDMATTGHPGTVVVPAALALAEDRNASGTELLTAVIAGYETMARVALGGVGMTARGFHSTPVTGVFGSAAAASYLLQLSAEQTAHALSISASRAGGIAEFTTSGGTEKRIHGAFASQAGMEAAALAAAGVTGPTAALEGQRGLLRAITDTPNPNAVTDELGTRFVCEGTGLKLHCCCGGQHTTLDAIDMLRAEHGFAPEDIERIDIALNPREFDAVARITDPQDVISAQFSVSFAIGLRLVNGSNGFSDYADADLNDPRVRDIARRVHPERRSPENPIIGDGPSIVTVTLRDGGQVSTHVSHPRGSAEFQLSADQVVEKFMTLAENALGSDRATKLANLVLRIDEVANLREITELLSVRNDYTPPSYDHLLGAAK